MNEIINSDYIGCILKAPPPSDTRIPYCLALVTNKKPISSTSSSSSSSSSLSFKTKTTSSSPTKITTQPIKTDPLTTPTKLTSQPSILLKQQDPIKQAIVSHCKFLTSLYKTNKINKTELLQQLNILFDKIWVDYNLGIIEKVPIEKITPLPKNFDIPKFLNDSKTLLYLLKNPQYLYTLYSSSFNNSYKDPTPIIINDNNSSNNNSNNNNSNNNINNNININNDNKNNVNNINNTNNVDGNCKCIINNKRKRI
ncbi:hypothetical protein DDB_G0283499 [Dictyostelium discoideum AX4]|uniref:Uncharacterized protein n=1 Tax=Dictyostelium discoideum TaxID=44689 RepID=Q54R40_DICDI|nr:hypothetical protein DDB_G0283499 [Dictyostelium discoideum AX4]EAL65734.2 hypothetical protein DDB_G0283499 [Dictyostelium discoideum AX4]|eukprot:XP_639051.2 hypothetical protein DDB_G0283499 [Dictyostelium discoideum AX4]